MKPYHWALVGSIGITIISVIVVSLIAKNTIETESGSMMHDADGGRGFIEAGDKLLVSPINARSDVVTWADATVGEDKGHDKFGLPGDVIVYRKNNDPASTPVIHRALFYIADSGNEKFTIEPPEICGDDKARCVDKQSFGTKENPIVIQIREGITIRLCRFTPAGPGFVTLGDNNGNHYDQGQLSRDCPGTGLPTRDGAHLQPAAVEHIVGVVIGKNIFVWLYPTALVSIAAPFVGVALWNRRLSASVTTNE